MTNYQFLSGVFAAALTPLREDASLALDELPGFLSFLVKRGCHGALLMGTTGEGPSFSPAERLQVFRAALHIRQDYPGFRLLVGTGTPSLEETIDLTRAALELGFRPLFCRLLLQSQHGLAAWFSQVIRRRAQGQTPRIPHPLHGSRAALA
jgi:4-hydroxy-tetrahydrodipicolinate synthase